MIQGCGNNHEEISINWAIHRCWKIKISSNKSGRVWLFFPFLTWGKTWLDDNCCFFGLSQVIWCYSNKKLLKKIIPLQMSLWPFFHCNCKFIVNFEVQWEKTIHKYRLQVTVFLITPSLTPSLNQIDVLMDR